MIHTDIIGDWGLKEEEIFPQNSVSGIGQCNNIKNTSTSSKDSLKGIQISHVKSLAVEQFSKNTNTLHPVLPLEMNLDPYSFLSSPGSSKSAGIPRNPATYSASSVGLGSCSVGSGSILECEERRMRLTRIVRSLEEEG